MSQELQAAKTLVQAATKALGAADIDQQVAVFSDYCADNFAWRGSRPFYEQDGVEAALSSFWAPLKTAFDHLDRREDVFFAGFNDCDGGESVWTCSMGQFVGLFDAPFLDIPPTRRLSHLRYAEFSQVQDGKIVQQAMFIDLIGLMLDAGVNPLPPMTGRYFVYPGPKTHDGILLGEHDPAEGRATVDLVNRMANDLADLNKSGFDNPPPEFLAKTWHWDMTWYGPSGIGATYTLPRYQQQHQFPFRQNLTDKVFNGHVARLGEGDYCAFFGWPNLNNRSKGGFIGMVGNDTNAEMRVVDVYRREGDKLAENWVIIDFPHYLAQQGLDVLARMRQLFGKEEL